MLYRRHHKQSFTQICAALAQHMMREMPLMNLRASTLECSSEISNFISSHLNFSSLLKKIIAAEFK